MFENLPNVLVQQICSFAKFTDIEKLSQISTSWFLSLNEPNNILWHTINFGNNWPLRNTENYFQWAAHYGNKEALIKLVMFYLYSGQEILVNILYRLEMSELDVLSFLKSLELQFYTKNKYQGISILFIRPPWRDSTMRKGKVCKLLKRMAKQIFSLESQSITYEDTLILYVMSKLYHIKKHTAELAYMEKAFLCGNNYALTDLLLLNKTLPYLIYTQMHGYNTSTKDFYLWLAHKLDGSAAKKLYIESTILYKCDTMFDESPFLFIKWFCESIYSFKEQKRYNKIKKQRNILISWLFQVITSLNYSSKVVHVTQVLMHMYLLKKNISITDYQLLGVACLIAASRFHHGKNVIAIIDGVKFTQSCYDYSQVMRMIGNVVFCIETEPYYCSILAVVKVIARYVNMTAQAECFYIMMCDILLLNICNLNSDLMQYLKEACLITLQIYTFNPLLNLEEIVKPLFNIPSIRLTIKSSLVIQDIKDWLNSEIAKSIFKIFSEDIKKKFNSDIKLDETILKIEKMQKYAWLKESSIHDESVSLNTSIFYVPAEIFIKMNANQDYSIPRPSCDTYITPSITEFKYMKRTI